MQPPSTRGDVPGTYYRLAMDYAGASSATSRSIGDGWRQRERVALHPHVPVAPQPAGLEDLRRAPRRLEQRRLPDRDDARRSAARCSCKGQPVPNTPQNRNRADLDYTGSVMPPPEAVKAGKVKPLTDEDRLTLVRWIDLGCPIDLDYDPTKPDEARLRLDARRPAADADADLPAGRREPAARRASWSACTTTTPAWTWTASR